MTIIPPPVLIERIHAAPGWVAIAVTGGGSEAMSALLTTAGASRTVLEAIVPYSTASLHAFLGGTPEQYCSERTARAMAMAAFQRALVYRPEEPELLAGIACTASLASDRPKRGAHRLYVAVQTSMRTEAWSLELEKGQRSRAEEEAVCGRAVLNAVASAKRIASRCELEISPAETLSERRCEPPAEWTELLLARRSSVAIGVDVAPRAVIFPGSFNPLHDGHRRMAEIAAEMLKSPVALEISIENVDKPPLDFLEIEGRVQALRTAGWPLWLTRAPRFETKAELFPGATFVVGADTIVRLADPRYYGNDERRTSSAIEKLATAGCRLLVFGRQVDGKFQTLADFNLPPALRAICREVPADQFRADISSTELRRAEG